MIETELQLYANDVADSIDLVELSETLYRNAAKQLHDLANDDSIADALEIDRDAYRQRLVEEMIRGYLMVSRELSIVVKFVKPYAENDSQLAIFDSLDLTKKLKFEEFVTAMTYADKVVPIAKQILHRRFNVEFA